MRLKSLAFALAISALATGAGAEPPGAGATPTTAKAAAPSGAAATPEAEAAPAIAEAAAPEAETPPTAAQATPPGAETTEPTVETAAPEAEPTPATADATPTGAEAAPPTAEAAAPEAEAAPASAETTAPGAETAIAPAAAPEPVKRPVKLAAKSMATADAICDLIETAAEAKGLPKNFFARLIWKESRFDIRAVSPVGAQGVAQFMPATAKARGLKDPFDPVQAIPASANFLAELRAAYGNFGLAAAAYNSGPNRVERWLKGLSGLPRETLDYVYSITGREADWFRKSSQKVENRPLVKDKEFKEACRAMPVLKTRSAGRPPWGVTVAAGGSRKAAQIAYQRAKRKLPGFARAYKTYFVKKRRRAAGPLYSARLGVNSRGAATQLCWRIRRAGAPCIVQKN